MTEMKRAICWHCGATNNYPMDSANKKVVCGRCKGELPKPGNVLEPTSNQFIRLLNGGLPLLVDFYSPTCAPCHMMHPVVEGLARRQAGDLLVAKLNVDLNPQIAAQFGIRGVPTFIVFSKGREIDRASGAMAEADFSLWVSSRI